MKLAGIFFQLATKICELEPRLKVAKLFCQWLGGDRFRVEADCSGLHQCKDRIFIVLQYAPVYPGSSLVEGDEGCIGPSVVFITNPKNMQHMHGIIPYMFD